jgi:hypothetical protein
MPRTKISEFSATAASNTDIDSINLAEGCAPSGINDAIRELMSQLKDFQTGAVGDSFNGPVGTTTAAAGAFTTLAASGAVTLSGGTANGVTYLNASKVVTSGTALVFDGTNLGVGTSSPSALLDIQGATGVIRNTATTGTNQVYTRQGNTGGFFYTGLDTSAGGFLTGSAYAGFLWMSGAYPMIFGTSNAEQMRLTSTGLGIGTSSPSTKLDVQAAEGRVLLTSTTGTNASYFTASNTGGTFNIGRDSSIGGLSGTAYAATLFSTGAYPMIFGTNGSERCRLDSSGNLIIGGTSNNYGGKLTVDGDIIARGNKVIGITGTGVAAGAFAFRNSVGVQKSAIASYYNIADEGNIEFVNGTSTNAVLTSSGNLSVGTTNVDARLTVTGPGNSTPVVSSKGTTSGDTTIQHYQLIKYDNDSTTSQVFVKFYINQGNSACGQINANGANQAAFGSTSDQRVKENIADLPSQLANIMALRPVEFDYLESYGGGHQIGFIAQEMQQVYPDVIAEDKSEEKILSITGWSKTEARLVKAIQEQQAIINSLKARLDAVNL